jgi:hypothetical protein
MAFRSGAFHARETFNDTACVIERTIAYSRRYESTPDFSARVQSALGTKAQSDALWARLMLDVLDPHAPEQELLDYIHAAPTDTNGAIGEVLKQYSSKLDNEEAQELGILLAWVPRVHRAI